MKRYSLTYSKNSTYWERDTNSLKDVQEFCRQNKRDYYCNASVYDNQKGIFIFDKYVLSCKAKIDLVLSVQGDLRTKNDKVKTK